MMRDRDREAWRAIQRILGIVAMTLGVAAVVIPIGIVRVTLGCLAILLTGFTFLRSLNEIE